MLIETINILYTYFYGNVLNKSFYQIFQSLPNEFFKMKKI